ncbi:MAG: nuclear transport factor 2 family protein [Gammaproteobacteria bacterium]
MSSPQIEQFIKNMNSIQHENAKHVLANIYTDDVVFIDPVKTIKGVENLTKYFEDLYKSVSSCHFKLTNNVPNNNRYSLEWIMTLQHKKISNNQEIELNGASFIEFIDDKVCYHRDYYDLGALVYERIPILGSVIKKIRHAI